MITTGDIDARGNVALWEVVDGAPRKVVMTAVDAQHALETDPDHWSLVAPTVVGMDFGNDPAVVIIEDGDEPKETE